MLFKIAWRNVWRHRTRSLVIIVAMTLGIWAGTVSIAFFNGMNEQRVRDNTKFQTSHLQIHNNGFLNDPSVRNSIPNHENVIKEISAIPAVKAYSERFSFEGLANTTTSNFGVKVLGIEPEKEAKLTGLNDALTDGEYFAGVKNPILIGKKLAARINAKIKSKIEINLPDTSGSTTRVVFKVAGIFETTSSIFDLSTVFVKASDLQRELKIEAPLIHEIAIETDNFLTVDSTAKELQKHFPDLDIKTWADLAPEVGYANEMMGLFNAIFLGIILGAMFLVIVNVMLMAVLERMREIGMLMALGMNRIKIFNLILLETVFLSFTGGPLGLLAGWATNSILHKTGVDLSSFSEGLQSFGIANKIYPEMAYGFYIKVPILVIITAILAAIYPAWKAVRLKPLDANRKIN